MDPRTDSFLENFSKQYLKERFNAFMQMQPRVVTPVIPPPPPPVVAQQFQIRIQEWHDRIKQSDDTVISLQKEVEQLKNTNDWLIQNNTKLQKENIKINNIYHCILDNYYFTLKAIKLTDIEKKIEAYILENDTSKILDPIFIILKLRKDSKLSYYKSIKCKHDNYCQVGLYCRFYHSEHEKQIIRYCVEMNEQKIQGNYIDYMPL